MRSVALRRVLAALAAVALVVAAVLVRRSWDDGGRVATSDPTDTSGAGAGSSDGVIACISDLATWCEQLDLDGSRLRVEAWSATVASFGTAEAPDAWITFDPLPSLATGYTAAPAIASTALIAVAKRDRSEAAVGTCGTDQFWTCVGNQAGASWTALSGQAGWSKVLLGFTDPAVSAVGALGLGAAAAAFFGTNQFGSTEIDSSDEFFAWYTRLVGSVPADALADPLALLLRRPSAVGIVATTAASYAGLVGTRTDEFPATYPGPMARAEVVVSVRDGSKVPSALPTRLQSLLVEAGWDAGSDTTTAPSLPPARTLVRLQGLWKEIRS